MWKEVDTVIYYLHPNFKYNPALAIFSFIETIIPMEQSNKDEEIKLKYCNDEIKPRLLEISEKGASIIIYHPIEIFRSEFLLNHAKKYFEKLIEDTDLPIVAFFSTKRNKYSKPFTNIWKLIELFYLKQNKTIDKSKSICVGHNAGRITATKKIIDYSCADRAFAHNVGIKFYTPEIIFQKSYKVVTWQYSPDIINQIDRKAVAEVKHRIIPPVIIDEINGLSKSDTYTLIITGPYSCGKTTLSKKIKRKWEADYKIGKVEHISENDYEIPEIENKIHETLKKKTSVIVDLNCILTNITKIIKVSMENKTPILIIEIKIEKELCRLLDFVKIQKSTNVKDCIITKYFWYEYYMQYKKPTYSILPCVRHVEFPMTVELSEEYWYEYSY